MSLLFTSGNQNIGASASASLPPVNILEFPLGNTLFQIRFPFLVKIRISNVGDMRMGES